MKPPPDAAAVLQPVFKLAGFFTAHGGHAVEIVEKMRPVVGMHDGLQKIRSFKDSRMVIAERCRESSIDEGVRSLSNVENVDRSGREFDDAVRHIFSDPAQQKN